MIAYKINEMAYPPSFDMDYFKSISSYKARIEYCNQHLKKLGAGSSRIAYQIDDQKVLKLAKNGKGISQNEAENDGYFMNIDIFAVVYDSHPDDHWIEMELCQPAKDKDFYDLLGVQYTDFQEYINLYADAYNGRIKRMPIEYNYINDEVNPRSHEWFFELECYMSDFLEGYCGDIGRISSWGISTKSGERRLVLIDYGLNREVFNQHYRK